MTYLRSPVGYMFPAVPKVRGSYGHGNGYQKTPEIHTARLLKLPFGRSVVRKLKQFSDTARAYLRSAEICAEPNT